MNISNFIFDNDDNSKKIEEIKECILKRLEKSKQYAFNFIPKANILQHQGVYCIYYKGTHPSYTSISKSKIPIYVGKTENLQVRRKNNLLSRMKNHKNSLEASKNTLNIKDFSFCVIKVNKFFITLTENILISHFKPIWNTKIRGFGNKVQGLGRKNQKPSKWDILHPDRFEQRKIKRNLREQKLKSLKEKKAATEKRVVNETPQETLFYFFSHR